MPISLKGAERRKARVRKSIKARAYGRPRLSVHRSDKNIYAQIIDDERGVTLAAASTLEGADAKQKGADRDAAARVGALVAQRALEKGVKDGFEKKLQIQGVGFRAAMAGKDIKLSLGFSHEVVFQAPKGITLAAPTQTDITVSGVDKQQVGEMAAQIRRIRPPEPYKGKGVRYAGEQVRRKEGKKK